ncbi:hypothetical protein HPB50_024131 [Hyalomma asiaticum]|uniref:Uncharacterized protein n=1 Tax=Hyalomma asiaticum TaxID=266040 RepID=A0ACB7SKB6_HYAAI|nr:hypothetical protein HPB50_024131 [Hyalomma asiaticum]
MHKVHELRRERAAAEQNKQPEQPKAQASVPDADAPAPKKRALRQRTCEGGSESQYLRCTDACRRATIKGSRLTLIRLKMANDNQGIWQWNCRGFAGKKAVLQQYIRHATRKPDVILSTARNTHERGYINRLQNAQQQNRGRGLCTLVRKRLTFVDHEISGVQMEHALIELIPTKRRKQSIFLQTPTTIPGVVSKDAGERPHDCRSLRFDAGQSAGQ